MEMEKHLGDPVHVGCVGQVKGFRFNSKGHWEFTGKREYSRQGNSIVQRPPEGRLVGHGSSGWTKAGELGVGVMRLGR